MESTCIHCHKRIVLINFAIGERWKHQLAGSASQDNMYEFCQLTVAEPIEESAIERMKIFRDAIIESVNKGQTVVIQETGDAKLLGNFLKYQETNRCPTCQGRRWSVKHGKWINTRETVDMVCQTCGRDYMTIEEGDKAEGFFERVHDVEDSVRKANGEDD